MSKEIPASEVLKEQIKLSNAELQRIASEGDMLGQPFDYVEREEISIPPGSAFPSSWNHNLVGSTIAHVNRLMGRVQSLNEGVNAEAVGKYQNKAIAVLAHLIENPGIIKTDLELETCEATRIACESFKWATTPNLYSQLENTMFELGNTYSMLIDGRRLIGFD